MKIMIVTLAMTKAGQGAYYNTQDIGLGRAFSELGHTVSIYNFIREREELIHHITDKLSVHYIRCKSLGAHSLHSYSFITPDTDAVICFSDNQIGFGRLKKRCDKQGVVCLPYVGVLGSHSANKYKKLLMDLFVSNNRFYKTMAVLAKTPQVAKDLEAIGAKKVILAPVGLDETLLHELPEQREKKHQILYLARMTKEKRPLEMADIFARLHEKDESLRLVAIGQGELAGAFWERIRELGLEQSVTYLERVLNADMWEYFCSSKLMINLNTEEIFGMAILEAMYYGCPVVARKAPGPEYIMEHGEDGILCEDNQMVITAVEQLLDDVANREEIAQKAMDKIRAQFLWKNTAEIIVNQIAD